MSQPCAHLRSGSRGTWRTLAGGIVARLCAGCVRELDSRTTEVHRAATPIEQYAVKEEIAMLNGCTYEVRKVPIVHCRVICEFGQTMCPRHIYLVEQEKIAAHEKEMAKEKKRQATVLAKHTQKGRAA